MEANGPIKHKSKARLAKKRTKHGKSPRKHHHHKHRHSRTSSSKSKGTGFLCCRGKKRKRGAKKRGKSLNRTKKQPHNRTVKTLPPVPNEQLGEIVLVKNIGKGKASTALKDPTSPGVAVAGGKAKSSKEKDTESEDKQPKSKSKKEEKEKPEIKIEKKEEEKKEKKEDDETNTDEKKLKWLCLAKQFVEEDARIAVNDFKQTAGYIPPNVSKHKFVKNMHKNRFSDVICLDHSRVSMSDATYIHANWVEVDNTNRVILTQLPLLSTAGDFWQMVIEQRVKCVLLLLTDAEYDTFGGDFVFPSNQDFLHFEHRSIRVGEFKRVEIMNGWSLKVLSVSNGDYKSFLHIHHYSSWNHNSVPDGGSPQAIKQIWQIQSVLRKYSRTSPAVFMSLSGCGRAGTFALFEVAHASLHTEQPTLNMGKCLEMVRNGRMHSCQTMAQFSFVYSLIAEHVLDNGFCKLVIQKKSGEEKDKEKEATDDEANVPMVLRQLAVTKC